MPIIKLYTRINAPIERCFNLARSIDLHLVSTRQTGEQAIAGRTYGLIELNETVTWRARHLGVWQTLTSKVTAMEAPFYFTDEMVNGAFKAFKHEHYFEEKNGVTTMTDVFSFTAPLGLLGRVANALFLTDYMKHLLQKRNDVIQEVAESEEWRKVLL